MQRNGNIENMKTPTSFKVENVTSAAMVHLRKRLAEDEVQSTSPNGLSPLTYINAHGVRATLDYTEVTGELDITVTHKPFFLPAKVVSIAIEGYINELDDNTGITALVTETAEPAAKSGVDPKVETVVK